MSRSNCCFLTCIQISQEADQVVWYSHLLKNFPPFIVIHTVKGFQARILEWIAISFSRGIFLTQGLILGLLYWQILYCLSHQWSSFLYSSSVYSCHFFLIFSPSVRSIPFLSIDYANALDCVDHNKLWKILKEIGIPDHLTCLLRNLYAGQEATVRTGHGTTDWFQIGKGVRQGCILSPCLFNLYAEYV